MNRAARNSLKDCRGFALRSLTRMRDVRRKLRAIDRRIDCLSEEIERKIRPSKAKPVILFILSLILLFISGVIVYRFAYKENLDFLAEYFSYVLPALGALFAGLGLYLRNDRLWYVFSGILVFMGSVAYLYTKPGFELVIIVFSSMFGVMIAISRIMVDWNNEDPYYFLDIKKVKKETILDVVTAIFLFAVMIVSYYKPVVVRPKEVYYLHCEPVGSKGESGDLVCTRTDGYDNNK